MKSVSRFLHFSILVLGVSVGFPTGASAEESLSPYMDQIREQMARDGKGESPAAEGSYTEKLKAKLRSEQGTSEGYTEALKAKLNEGTTSSGQPSSESPAEGYGLRERQRLLEANPPRSAIQAVAEGRSELQAKRRGEIHWGAQFKLGASITRTVTATDASLVSQSFSGVYGTGWSPDLQISGEWQPFHSEWFGNVGIVAGTGFTSFRGKGVFSVNLTNPVTSTPFGTESRTVFRYLMVPVWVGANYRFNLLRIVRPYVQGAAGVIGAFETREDTEAKRNAMSRAVFMSAGAALWLNPLLPKTAWELYDGTGVHHYSLIIDYTRVLPVGSGVRVASQGISVGLLYEF